MTSRELWEPDIFPPAEEPEWVAGYEMTASGWKAMDAAREEDALREAEESIDRDGGIPHEQVMAGLRAMHEALLVAPAK